MKFLHPVGISLTLLGIVWAITTFALDHVGGELLALMVLAAISIFPFAAISDLTPSTYAQAGILATITFLGIGDVLEERALYALFAWIAGLILGSALELVRARMAHSSSALGDSQGWRAT